MSSSFAQRPARGFTPEAIEHARQRYEETDETLASIAADFGVHSKTLRTLAHKQGWKLRKDRPPRDLPEAIRLNLLADQAVGAAASEASPDPAMVPAPGEMAASLNIAARLEQALEKDLRKVEALRNAFGNPAHRSIEAERTARTLATLTETLFKVRRLREPGQTGAIADDDMPADLDGFRHALAQRMDAFVRSRADGDLPADGRSPHANPPAP
jgi:transposase-like protein